MAESKCGSTAISPQGSGPAQAAPPRLPAIDRIYVSVAGRSATLRQHATWITGTGINFVEEEALNRVARMVDEQEVLGADVERALSSWATSSGKKAIRYFLAIIEHLMDDKKTRLANGRKASYDPDLERGKKLFDDKEEAGQFVAWLKGQGIKGWTGRDGLLVGADNVHELYKTFEKREGR